MLFRSTEAELKALQAEYTKRFQASKDTEGFGMVMAAVNARRAKLKESST